MNHVFVIGVLLLLLVAVLGLSVKRARRRMVSWEVLQARLIAVDVEAFRNLADPAQERFLRNRLSHRQYLKVQQARRRAMIEYLHRVAHNAAVLIQAAEAARSSADPAVAKSGADLAATAVAARLYALAALARLYLGLLLPFVPLSCESVLEIYERLSLGLLRISPALR